VYSRILLPLDRSKFAERVLPYARALARGIQAPVELLFVHEPGRPGAEALAASARSYLDDVAGTFSGIPSITATVESGEPAEIIATRAAAEREALIAMATHGLSGGRRWLMGSVAEKVLHQAENNMLLVRPGEESAGEAALKTVLVPLDGSRLAEAVLPAASALAAAMKMKVVLVRVLPQLYFAPPDGVLPVFGANVVNQKRIWDQARAAAREYLEGKAEHLRRAGLINVSSLVIDSSAGGAAAEIIDLARRSSDSLVAMSTHGAAGLRRWVLGSITQRVIQYSSDPVLVIRPRS
jgi:nucleotide-binding universal stress UspA family protein